MRKTASDSEKSFEFQVSSFKFADNNLKHETWNLKLNVRGQHLAEYALAFSLVIAAIFGMQTYAKRGLQARYRTAMDAATSAIRAPAQYEPYYAHSASIVSQDASSTVTYQPGGAVTRTERQDARTESGTEQIGASTRMGDAWR